MKKVVVLVAILALAILLIGCGQSQSKYDYTGAAASGGQAPVVGGGCGVSEQAEYSETQSVDAQSSF